MINYKDKYLKYKSKYNSTRNTINMSIDNEINSFIDPIIFPRIEKINYGNLNILNIILDVDTTKPVLIVVAGISHNSFLGTSKIIFSKLFELQLKFKNIYIIDCDSYKSNQIKACNKRDNVYNKQNLDALYQPEETMNNEIAEYINSFVNSLQLINCHLLGKCNGGWIVTLLLLKNLDVYKALYLAVPAIPFGIYNYISQINISYLQNIKFIFAWTLQDHFSFHWNMLSYQEKERYDDEINQFKYDNNTKLNYISLMYYNSLRPDNKKYHEIHTNMLTEIVNN